MVLGIKLKDLRHGEFIQFSHNILSIVQRNDPGSLGVFAQYNAFSIKTTEIETIYLTDQTNPLTATIEALDLRRDRAMSGIQMHIEAARFHFDPARAATAELLAHNLNIYGESIARQNYALETSNIINLIADWTNKPDLANAIVSLGLADWKAELQAANTAFDTQYLNRNEQLAAANPNTLLALRPEAYNLYYALRDNIAARHTINNGANPWGKTLNEINMLIEQFNTRIGQSIEPNEPTEHEPTPEG